MSRLWYWCVLGAGLAIHVGAQAALEYSATQTIHTTPGPFINQIYVSAQKQRQDAQLGGQIVSTIIRHDQGVAWLLIPEKKQYQTLDISQLGMASVQPVWQSATKTDLGEEISHGVTLQRYALTSQGQPMRIGVNQQGVVVETEFLANPTEGTPAARMVLSNIQIGALDPRLFELPSDYQPRP